LLFYVGAEERIESRSALVHAAIVSEGVSLLSNELVAVALISRVLGGHPSVEYSATKPSSKLFKAAASSVPGGNFAVCVAASFASVASTNHLSSLPGR